MRNLLHSSPSLREQLIKRLSVTEIAKMNLLLTDWGGDKVDKEFFVFYLLRVPEETQTVRTCANCSFLEELTVTAAKNPEVHARVDLNDFHIRLTKWSAG